MYIPSPFREEDPAKLWEFVERRSFGLLVCDVDGRPFASHLPMLFGRSAAPEPRTMGPSAD